MIGNYNDALGRVRSQFVWVLPDDDAGTPRFLERTVPLLRAHADVGVVSTAHTVVDSDGRTSIPHETLAWRRGTFVASREQFLVQSMRRHMVINHPSALCRTEALVGAGLFQEDDRPAPDVGLWLRVALSWGVAFLDEPLVRFRVHTTSFGPSVGTANASGLTADEGWPARMLAIKMRFLALHAAQVSDSPEARPACEALAPFAHARLDADVVCDPGPSSRCVSMAGRIDSKRRPNGLRVASVAPRRCRSARPVGGEQPSSQGVDAVLTSRQGISDSSRTDVHRRSEVRPACKRQARDADRKGGAGSGDR